MTSITRGHRIYFGAVGLLAIWVGIWGYLFPSYVDEVIPWLVPPLHARFLGAMYLSAAAAMGGCIRAHRWAEVKVVMPPIAIWTGMLFIISLLYLDEFDFARSQVWIWFSAYFFYPLIAIWLAWQNRAVDTTAGTATIPKWVNLYLLGQGIIITMLALVLLFLPDFMVAEWPWKITPLLAQLYSAPFLAYGVVSLMMFRRTTWLETRIAIQAILVFASGVLLASIIHRNLFSTNDIADWLWFGGFTLAVLMLSLLTFRAFQATKDEHLSVES